MFRTDSQHQKNVDLHSARPTVASVRTRVAPSHLPVVARRVMPVWENIQAACSRGSLTTREAEALCIPACLRSEAEILAPFNASSPVAGLLEPQLLEFARTQVHGERTRPHAVLAARVRRRIESVWGGMFVTQLMRLGRDDATARAVLQDVWDGVEEILVHDTSRAAAGARVMPRRSPTTPARTGAVIRSRYPMGPRILDDTLAQRGASDGHRGRADDDHEGRVRPAATLFSASLPAIVPPQAQRIGSDTPIETSCRCRFGFVAEGNDEALVRTEQLSPPPSANAGLGNDAPLSTGSVHHVSTCGQGPNHSSTEMCQVPGTRCRRRPAGFRYVVRR